MELCLACLPLVTLLTLLTSEVTPSLAQKVYTNTWAVHIPGGEEEANRIARKHGFINHGNIFGEYYHFRHRRVVKRSLSQHRGTHIRLHREPQVKWAEQQVVKQRKKRDIYSEPADPKFAQQWYLYNSNHHDLNVKEAWKQGVTGQGVVVSILDDGIEKNHPDLERNYDPDASYDVNDGDPDPQPRYTQLNDNRHGTRCAGEVAAVANNDICGVGVAYNAKIGGVRMLDGEVTDVVEAQSLSLNPQHIDIYSASWGPEDDGKTVDGPAKLAKEAFLRGVTEGRGGLGSIFVWASGNGGREKDSCNCDGYTNSIYTLSISSSTQYGNVPWYSEACSSTLATTYSSGGLNEKQIITTDLRQKCTDSHTGTSASAPLAAGIIALALEANKNLTWRDMQHLVVRTSNPTHLITNDWKTNGVGRKVSHSYGYGLLDAAAIVAQAKNWTNVGPQQKCIISMVSESRNIGSHLVITKGVDACSGKPNFVSSLEHVQAQLTLSYNRRGNLAIYLISPQGTRSTLLAPRPHDYSSEGFNDWAFMSTHSWDEDPRGEWTLEIENVASTSDYGTLTQFTLVLYGTASTSAGLSAPDSIQLPEDGCKTYDLSQICTECNPGFYMYQQGCVRVCPAGFTSVSNSELWSQNEVAPVLHPACMPCHELCLTCSGTGPKDCLSCPPHSHLDTLTGTCQHQNQIQRESPDAGLFPSRGSASSSILNLEISSSLPATVAVLCCAFIAATFVVVFGLLQFRSYSLTKVCSSEASVGSVMRASFGLGMARSGVISYKGIPSVWNEDGGNSESENDEFDIHNERTAFIKTQSAL
ncbi:furin (paired basic amino acid cleaving enzyme) a [Pangasianodon hypophthalmus]|uniref:furin (paired basic amino acid cleaving enzyme) a n=1 Tax=Pangasianodon hypophthalmus TaxID=310915 RepID=UPI000EFF7520|nr:furin (paired basic amino acid cleaving enzyme) a [Pangasianodon hypophthalmus]XP_053094137.1 furin (paired basic amino acid cleaving enzyme) a [Pangasianodon hypophthalmus]XP_053094138.1 furin (paired basic amino acid cleaving enzyme) a [Pangasianodon hypophthalmus]XP_053094139.1 furin (paired basic amino acid cleaving enzyme) a [Pangasianodon hypophthalmus]